jgi:hypothetical protein
MGLRGPASAIGGVARACVNDGAQACVRDDARACVNGVAQACVRDDARACRNDGVAEAAMASTVTVAVASGTGATTAAVTRTTAGVATGRAGTEGVATGRAVTTAAVTVTAAAVQRPSRHAAEQTADRTGQAQAGRARTVFRCVFASSARVPSRQPCCQRRWLRDPCRSGRCG